VVTKVSRAAKYTAYKFCCLLGESPIAIALIDKSMSAIALSTTGGDYNC